ncbi:hypothetical protein MHH60_02400 [Paenibacillus sp. FSL H7-0716]|uniref:Uncharacterized protein n=1 Tax=Paenibacillus odorifer TaxID=189426 RepID=A0AB36JHU1_9BACL|nr:hypothetical protein BSK47_01940 [Paenibacillus odorifer]
MSPQAALDTINAYYVQQAGDAPDHSIFDTTGVTGVTPSNLTYVDYALSVDETSPWTVLEIQEIVNEVHSGLVLTAIGTGLSHAVLNSIFIPVLTFELNLMTLPVWVSLLFF